MSVSSRHVAGGCKHMKRPSVPLLLAATCVGALSGVACDGAIGGNSMSTGGGITGVAGSTGSGGSSNVPPDPNAAGLLPARRLTSREYLATVRDLLSDTTLKIDDVPGLSL